MSRDFAPGQVLDHRFTLIERIGTGAVGSVWRARDAQRNHDVAIKLIVPVDGEGRVSRTKIGRFMREARAMARLRSPHVVRVYDHGSLHGDGSSGSLSASASSHGGSNSPAESGVEVVYIAMEVLVGEPLRARLKRRKTVDPATTLRMLRHVGRAVDFAHQRGIVHRDLKPANIFLCDEGDGRFVGKVLDFGMVKSLGMPLATLDLVKTELGRPIGTPYYMSPEQARGQSNVDHRTDLWAMGVIAYECLVGQRPFKGKSLAKVFTEIAAGTLPIPSEEGEVPRGFDAWFRRAVSRDIQKRFQSVRVLIDELEEVLGPAGGTTATGLRRDQLGLTMATMSDVEASDELHSIGVMEPSLTDRTLRRAPKSAGASFLGRDEELAQMDEAIASHCRVLTLQGFAGVGKARTAREYGRRAAGRYPGGLWLTSLADVSDADGMWLVFSTVLGVHLGEGEPAARIGRALAGLGKAMLLIENVDGVRAHLATTLTQWLAAAPQALFIVTSRRALALPTERVIRVHALPFPPEQGLASLTDTKRWTATELLVRRAISFNRQLLGSQNYAPALGQLAGRAQGNALGLELLASQTQTIDPIAMVEVLGTTLVHETGTTIIQPDAVLSGIIDWVLSNLAPHERMLLGQLAAFHRGFTAAAAEQVVDLSRWEDAPPVANILRRLARRSLLQRSGERTGEPRFSLHPVILELVRERALGEEEDDPAWLAPEEQLALRSRHARYFAQLGAPEAIEALERRGGSLRRARLMAEVENLRVAKNHATDERDGSVAAACALALATVDRLMGRHSAAAQRLVGPSSVSETPPAARVRCLLMQSWALLADGRADAAERGLGRLRQVLTEARGSEIDRGAAEFEALSLQAALCRHVGEIARAMQLIVHARQVAFDRQDRSGVAEAELQRARWLRETGSVAEAKQVLQTTRGTLVEMGATARLAEVLEELGHCYTAAGQREAAEDALGEALTRYRELGDRYREAAVLGELGDRALEIGDLDQALSQLTMAVGRARELGAADVESRYLAATAHTLQLLGRDEDAWKRLVQAEQLLRFESDHARAELVGILCRRALMEERHQAYDDARRSIREAEALMEDIAFPLATRVVPTLHQLKRRLQS